MIFECLYLFYENFFFFFFFQIEKDHRQIENEYLLQQQSMLSKSAALNEMLSFKKELEKSEIQREQLADRLEVN